MSVAIIFPGQGSQSIGMMADLAQAQPVVGETFAEASDALGYDLWQLCQEGPEADLNQTDKTQPAMLAAGVATWRAWQAAGGDQAVVMAGHSLGEYTALVAAGALDFSTAVKLVEKRGRFMQEAVPAGTGAMAAILGLADEEVIKACDQAAEGDVVEAVNFNAPGQVVIAGTAAAVERAVVAAKDAGAKRAVVLPVSVPSHCALMKPAADKLSADLASVEIAAPAIEVLHNVDVSAHSAADAIRDALVGQLYSPVRWVETIQAIAGRNVDAVVECGPGKVLAGLNRRIDRSLNSATIADAAGLQAAIDAVNK